MWGGGGGEDTGGGTADLGATEMEGRNGEERGLVAHGDREGLLMDEPWLLIRSDLRWVRTFTLGKCFWKIRLSGTILLRFSRRGTADVLLGATRSSPLRVNSSPRRPERRVEVRRSRREDAKLGRLIPNNRDLIDCECEVCFLFFSPFPAIVKVKLNRENLMGVIISARPGEGP